MASVTVVMESGMVLTAVVQEVTTGTVIGTTTDVSGTLPKT